MATATQIVQGLWQINLGAVNAFLLDQDELTLIDTGTPKSADKIVAAIEAIGKNVTDLKHIIVTHCHPDHAGSVAALKRMSGARVYMHPIDAAMVRKGECGRPMTPAPGLLRGLMFRLFVPKNPTPIDACANMPNFGYAIGYESLEEGKQSLRKLASLDFDVAVFGHGAAMKTSASQKFRQTFAS